ncbi:FAD-dependent oxidoreductase [Zobellia galactanivorans]|uniref:Possible pyridine nucleotide-disulphide oxidoreductase n=1 Tax=Zobellia galactanivorans (strain DSM 12802 / CCUG 47099 / CIP 106680 / NCIMB 13871 / Dsij) TaxID=63186 RepID=G0L8I3_ZOBGA|nr:FAD-dependent oxidoreductase [Zobellia galactanivorans]CAZ97591.1 Possible pyridine nucleotide-disulphide oxidoreductase [Zobellia galactanivorans]
MMKTMSIRFILCLCVCILQIGCTSREKSENLDADVIIYGGTSAAIASAVQLARMDKSVLIVCPEKHIGGLSASGLGFTDLGNKRVIGGISKEFYQEVYKHYQNEEAWNWQPRSEYGNEGQGTTAIDDEFKTMWTFEPHVAEQIFEKFVKDHNITILRDKWLDRENGVEVKDGEIVSITMLDGESYKGKIFVDATYEGDLMAAAGVNYHVGREANSVYNEEWNGVQKGVYHHSHNFQQLNISPYIIPGDSTSGLLPRISAEAPGEQGSGDKRVQAYNYRLCTTNAEGNVVPFEKPENYDPKEYELLRRVFKAGRYSMFGGGKIPNMKRDVNNVGPFSSDNIGMNYEYPEASYEKRKEILEEHINYHKGLLYFWGHDESVPERFRTSIGKWGLAKDEFVDNGHWPYQIYVREARRMIGEFVMTDNEILGKSEVRKPIGMGSYAMDSHNVQRYVTKEGYVQNEGDLGVEPEKPYQIHLGTILPKRKECKNLLVTAAISSSHIAFGSIRMEPVFMILGQSAATLASMALDKDRAIHDVPYGELRKKLLADGQVLEYNPEN